MPLLFSVEIGTLEENLSLYIYLKETLKPTLERILDILKGTEE